MIAVAPVCCGCNSIKSNVIPVISNQINDAMRINEPSFWITILHNLILIKKCVLFTDLLLINDSPRATLNLKFLNKLQSELCWKFIFIWRTFMLLIFIIILLCFNPNRNGSNSRIVLQTPEQAPELVNPVKLSDKSIEGRSLNSEIVLKIWKLVHNYLVCDFFWIINSSIPRSYLTVIQGQEIEW